MTDPQFRAWAAQQLTAARAEIATLLAGPNEDTAAYETWQSGVKRGLVAALGDGHELVGEFASLTMVHAAYVLNGLRGPSDKHESRNPPHDVLRRTDALLSYVLAMIEHHEVIVADAGGARQTGATGGSLSHTTGALELQSSMPGSSEWRSDPAQRLWHPIESVTTIPAEVFGDAIALSGDGAQRRPAGERHDATAPAQTGRYESPTPAPSKKSWGRWIATDERPFKTTTMSEIWRVREDGSAPHKHYALKVMRYRKGRGSLAYRRFVREIEVLAKHCAGLRGVIQLVAFGVPDENDDAFPYFVMPLASGSLADTGLALKGSTERVLSLFEMVAETLSATHAIGIIHRDLKPANLLVFSDQDFLVVADFGICFLEEEDRLTHAGAGTVGTRDFVAPELLGGGMSDANNQAADVYSLAKTLYAVLAGGDVFPREHHQDPRFDLALRFDDDRMRHIHGVVALCIREKPEERPQSMLEVRDLLAAARENVRAGVPYVDGMYRDGPSAESRCVSITRQLASAQSTQRDDQLRYEIAAAIAAGVAVARAYGATTSHGQAHGQFYEPAATAAVAVAEEFLAVAVPLVVANEAGMFEEWLADMLDVAMASNDFEMFPDRTVLRLGAALAATAAGAVGWVRQRFAILRIVVDRYVSQQKEWTYHDRVLGPSMRARVVWHLQALEASQVLRRASFTPDDVRAGMSMVWGLAVLRALAAAEQQRLMAFLAQPAGIDFPVAFMNGLFAIDWVADLLRVAHAGGPRARYLAREVFGMTPEEFAAHCGGLSPALIATSTQARLRHGSVVPFALGADEDNWHRWSGGWLR